MKNIQLEKQYLHKRLQYFNFQKTSSCIQHITNFSLYWLPERGLVR